jgi:DNA-binding transcriptional LysR family regulator
VEAYPLARAGVDVLAFRDDRLGVVTSPTHPFASKAKVSVQALAGTPFISFDRESPTRKALERMFREKGVVVEPAMEIDNVETIKRAVELGLGAAVLPLACVQHEVSNGTLVAKPFAEGTLSRPIGILIRKGKYLDRAAQSVLDAFKAAAGADT